MRSSAATSRVLRDIAIAAVALVVSLLLMSHAVAGALGLGAPDGSADAAGWRLDLVGVLLVVATAAPLALWRRSPLGALVATVVAAMALALRGYPVDLVPGPVVALYLLAASRTTASPWTWRTTLTVVGLLTSYLAATALARGGFPGLDLFHTGLAWAVAWFAGERTRLRREQTTELEQRALRAERDAERERLLAVAEERARIARDLHDSAGHAISVIGVRAGAARLRHGQDPDRAVAALAAIEELARQTVTEIDQFVGTLRADGATANGPVEVPAGLASLDTLVAQHASAGMAVIVDRQGEPRPLGTVVDQSAYRIVQEALTNAARHGQGGARAVIAYRDSGLELTVTNPVSALHGQPVAHGGGGHSGGGHSGGGHGIVGMRERATMLGGTLDATRRSGRFKVRATIPYGGPPA